LVLEEKMLGAGLPLLEIVIDGNNRNILWRFFGRYVGYSTVGVYVTTLQWGATLTYLIVNHRQGKGEK
jgi:hypothetical protein